MHMNKVYQAWLNYEQLDSNLRSQLEAMSEDEIEDAFYKPLSFGTGGMRGVMGPGINRMNVYTLRKAAYGFAKFLINHHHDAKTRGVAIAYDNRHQSDVFAKACVEVLGAFGIKAFLFEHLRPTPVLSFAVRETGACGGIVVTASHNPPEYNGFKIYDEHGCQLVPDLADHVVGHVDAVDDVFAIKTMPYEEAKSAGLVTLLSRDMDNKYLKRIMEVQLRPNAKKDLKVVFSPLHGASREIGLRALTEAGYSVIPVEEQMVPDSDFSTVKSPNPEDTKAFEYAVKYGRDHQADLLVATDPDGDRVGFAVRHEGNYVYLNGNQTGAIFIDYLLKTLKELNQFPDKGVLFNTIVTSEFGAAIAKSWGIEVRSTLTGFKFIGEQMKALEDSRNTFVMGYEESYGYVIKDFVRDKDANQAMVLASEIANELKREGKTMIDYLHELYKQYGAYREDLISLTLEGKQGNEMITKIMAAFRDYFPETFLGRKVLIKEDYLTKSRFEEGHEHIMDYPKSDVLKFILSDNAWFVLRPSGTEPKLKIYIALKAHSIEEADQQITELKDAIMDKIDGIKTQK